MDDFLQIVEKLLEGTGVSVYDPEMAPDILLVCDEHGSVFEIDGHGPCGCVSPLRGVIV